MSFLQPWLLAALPLAALPVVIHLLYKRRRQTVEWGAMRFLLQADRMSRGYVRLRRLLIMAARVLAIGVLILGVSRPLSSGWVGGVAGGEPDATLVLLDRSPSMQRRTSGVSKLETARRQLEETFETLGSKRWVLIDSATNEPREFATPSEMLDSPHVAGVSAAADLPAMVRSAHDYLRANNLGRADVWIVSDTRANDWRVEDGRWPTLAESLRDLPGRARFRLLAFTESPSAAAPNENLSVRVTEARREAVGDGAELVLSLAVDRDAADDQGLTRRAVPLRLEIDGARSELEIELEGGRAELKGYRVALPGDTARGWGRVSLPADTNPADDQSFFVFDEPPVRKTGVVAEDTQAVRPVALAAQVAPGPGVRHEVSVVEPSGTATLEWEELALLVWQAPLPTGDDAERVRRFIDRGGRALFFPPSKPSDDRFLGVGWGEWAAPSEQVTPAGWRRDQDLLADSRGGAVLPVGRWRVSRSCQLLGEARTLARLPGEGDEQPLLARVTTDAGGVYFCATTVDPQDSSLAADGLVLYALVQRAIGEGAESLGAARAQAAGTPLPSTAEPWRLVAGGASDDAPALSVDYAYHQGVYASGDRLLAVNRSVTEDGAGVVPADKVDGLFAGLDFQRIDNASPGGGLVREVWRLFLVAVLVALAAEAVLSLPRVATASPAIAPSPAENVWPSADRGRKREEAVA